MGFRGSWLVLLVLVLLTTLPAAAYVDPSGGLLFQVLMPTLAAIWGMWMLFAQRIRRGLSSVLRRIRGNGGENPVS